MQISGSMLPNYIIIDIDKIGISKTNTIKKGYYFYIVQFGRFVFSKLSLIFFIKRFRGLHYSNIISFKSNK